MKIQYNNRVIGLTEPKEGQSKADWIAANKKAPAFKGQANADTVLGDVYDSIVPPKPAKKGKVEDKALETPPVTE